MSRLDRRSFLRGAGLGLPLAFAPLSRARAVPPKFPKRFVYFHTPNGSIPSAWTPKTVGKELELSEILAPLAPHKKELLVLSGIDLESSYHGPGGDVGHANGMGHVLTGTELLAGGHEAANGGGISIDQAVAAKIGAGTKLRSLELGVQASGPTGWLRTSYTAPGVSLPVESDPRRVFDRVFAPLGADPLGLARLRARRRSVLDAVAKEFAAVRPTLASHDRGKLDVHLAAVRDIETRLDSLAVLGGRCKKPPEPEHVPVFKNESYPILGKLQMDLLVMALACDLTRVGSLLWAGAANNAQVFRWIGIEQSHHELTHAAPSEADAHLIAIQRWYAEQFGYLLAAMKAIPEGSGTMLDHSLVLWGSELAVGNTHSRRGMPFVLAGSASGYFATGRHVAFKGQPHNDLLITIANAMGLEAKTFGNPKYCSGPLESLRA